MRGLAATGLAAGLAVATWTAAVPAAAKGKAPNREACRLLRATEVTQALEQPSAEPAAGATPLVCDWMLQATDSRPLGAVSVYLQRGDGAREAFTLLKDFHQDVRVRVRGLGRRAYYAQGMGTLFVLEDPETMFYVQGVYPTDSNVDDGSLQRALVGLAGKAERRI